MERVRNGKQARGFTPVELLILGGVHVLLCMTPSFADSESPRVESNPIAPDQPAPRVPTMVRCDKAATVSAVEYARRQLGDLLHTKDDIESAGEALVVVILGGLGTPSRTHDARART